jgi:hypothetical protein
MAKRLPKPEANDAAAAAPPAMKPRARKRTAAGGARQAGPETITGLNAPPDVSETYAAPDTVVAATAAGDLPQEHAGDASSLQLGSASMASSPTEDDIRMRAYQLYLERGRAPGRDFDDWLSAERELRKRRG